MSRILTLLLCLVCGMMALNLFQKGRPSCGTLFVPSDSFITAKAGESSDLNKNDSAAVAPRGRRSILPERLIAVFGLESSGTTFVQKTLAEALQLGIQEGIEYRNRNGTIRIQHLSLPTGWYPPGHNKDAAAHQYEPLPVVPLYIPERCRQKQGPYHRHHQPTAAAAPTTECLPYGLNLTSLPTTNTRFFVNVTSHITWHRERNVDARAVVVVRDPSLHFRGIIKKHCPNETAAYQQYKQGVDILQHAMTQHIQPITVVSYETLMTLKGGYLKEIYKQLDIESQYIPAAFNNGNVKYVPSTPTVMQQQLLLDDDDDGTKAYK
jgi:hypothetical protein